ncbi:hypothetical protein EVAR_14501_1 [Eumeta japonica]|uniref:Uncharacterized protein n=1 Tax=Eumeta variegata TaxID=151549 RepID=A0A4C1U324_EUMVA|nr:hypothetical protein EVAR_14501_1 [Eumeta japonica]
MRAESRTEPWLESSVELKLEPRVCSESEQGTVPRSEIRAGLHNPNLLSPRPGSELKARLRLKSKVRQIGLIAPNAPGAAGPEKRVERRRKRDTENDLRLLSIVASKCTWPRLLEHPSSFSHDTAEYDSLMLACPYQTVVSSSSPRGEHAAGLVSLLPENTSDRVERSRLTEYKTDLILHTRLVLCDRFMCCYGPVYTSMARVYLADSASHSPSSFSLSSLSAYVARSWF